MGCGSNKAYQLGSAESTDPQTLPSLIFGIANHMCVKVVASSHSAAITNLGELFLWGTGVFGEYKIPSKILTISN